MFWEIYQQSQIHDAKSTASRAQSVAGSTEARLKMLERRLEGLALACQSLWEISSTKLNLTPELLMEKMNEVDMRDGQLDGRMHTVAKTCPQCHRNSSGKRTACVYCGTHLPDDGHLFHV